MKTALAVGGVVVIGGLVYVMTRKGTTGEDGGYTAGLRCKAGRVIAAIYGQKISDEQCEKADAIDDLIGLGALKKLLPKSWAAKDTENREKNGAISIPLTPEITSWTGAAERKAASFEMRSLLNGTSLRFANGGVPFANHPDFARCAEGTHDMTSPGLAFWCVTPGKRPSSSQMVAAFANAEKEYAARVKLWAAIGLRWEPTPRISDMFRGSGGDPTTNVAASIVGGVKHVCPSGQVLIDVLPVTDHRTGESVQSTVKRCGATGATPGVVAPGVAPSGLTTVYTHPVPVGGLPVGTLNTAGTHRWTGAHWERV